MNLREQLLDFKLKDTELGGIVEECHPEEVVAQFTFLFEGWAPFVAHLPPEDQNKVVWRIIGFPIFVGFLVESVDVSLDHRLALLRSMKQVTMAIPELHPANDPMENGYFMWWDSVAADLATFALRDEALKILEELAFHPDHRVRYAALHGLGHLSHPGRAEVIDRYIKWDYAAAQEPGFHQWLLECRDGTVM